MEIISGKVRKYYNNQTVFTQADITIDQGEIYLVVGRNGIGKSTLLRLLAKVENQAPHPEIKKHNIDEKNISYMPSDLVYYPSMSVMDLISFYDDTHSRFLFSYAKKYLEKFNINLNSKVNHLSDGERKIVAFVICLSFKCSLYIIDEPFPNVDLLNDELFRKMIIERYDESTTFIIATHQINEFEKISSKCILIKDSKTIDTMNTDDIRNENELSVEDYFKEVLK